jgi:hypothetical protein
MSQSLKMLIEDGKVYIEESQAAKIRSILVYTDVKHFEFPLGKKTMFELDIE